MPNIIGAPTLDDALSALSAAVSENEGRGERTLIFCEDKVTLLAERAVLDLVERRPATTADLTIALGRPQEEIQILLDNLFQHGFLEMEKRERGIFYAPARR